MNSAPATQPLAGVRVVENDSFVAGPSACLGLVHMGAEVIKIDPLGGGPDIERWPLPDSGRSLYWASLNQGKRSVAIDLRKPAGKELAQNLITAPGETAGVFVENNVGRPFLADDVLRAQRHDLIHIKVQGLANGDPGVDYTVNAASGIPHITGPVDSTGPVNHALPAWDLLCGQAACTAVTTGLYRRATTGEGSYSQIALHDVALAAVANLGWYTETLQAAGPRVKHGNDIFGSFGANFACADGVHVMAAAVTTRQWQALVTATGLGDVISALENSLGTDFTHEAHRYAHRGVLTAVLRPWFSAQTSVQVEEALAGSGVLWAPYRRLEDIATTHLGGGKKNESPGQEGDDEMPPASVLRTMNDPDIGQMIVAASPIRFAGEYAGSFRPVRLGADTDSVLAEVLGMSNPEIGRLHDNGVIAS